ncbi:MAG: tetratricopeptide repeat protein [Sporocytophaga sp.]|nr:tetratricopeptide repeat protein [Sporocytophaga sp.]
MNVKKLYISLTTLVAFLFLAGSNFLYAQVSPEIKIANEYYNNQEYSKALTEYEKVSKRVENLPLIYSNYYNSLIHEKNITEGEKLIKKMIKSSPNESFYKADLYLHLQKFSSQEKAQKEFSNLSEAVRENQSLTEKIADYLVKSGNVDKAAELYINSRKALNNRNLYSFKLAELYKIQNNDALMIEEMLNYLKNDPNELENVKNQFQNILTEKEDFDLLETSLYDKIQKDPNDAAFNEMLLWMNIQQKNFTKAFMQSKALDKRYKMQGMKMIEVGRIAMENKDYEAASKFFQYVVDEHKNGVHYGQAKRMLINSREELVKNTFPVSESQIRLLIADYANLIKELGKSPYTTEAMKNMALLEAFYLDKKDTAIIILNDALNYSRNDSRLSAKIKIDLGDIYLLKEEPWEATLLYSQAEKAMKEDPIGHEAKLKNAKLNYYKGEFELAQEHLDILKMATSREISNDAMNLSLLIQDNTILDTDTTNEAMKQYAKIDFLLFRNKNLEAIEMAEEILRKYPKHSLADEVLLLQAKIYRKLADFDKSLLALEKINVSFSNDILGDDALFLTGIIYEENKKDNQKAMQIYQDFMIKYPGSIFNVEARKRFRKLRGDKI